MNRTPLLSLLAGASMLVGCGSDFDSNPIVITREFEDIIIISDTTPMPDETADLFSQDQKSLLMASLWQSGCVNSQRIEMTFSQTDRTSLIYTYDDAACTQLSMAPTEVVEPYVITQRVLDDRGFDASRIEFRTPTVGGNILNRSIFSVTSTLLYFGTPLSNGLAFDTTLDFNRPHYPISDNERITFLPPEIP